MRKLGFGLLWFLALSFGALISGGAVVGCQAGIEHPENAQAAGEAAGQLFAQKYMGAIFIFALVVSVVGSAFGLLPGTGKKSG